MPQARRWVLYLMLGLVFGLPGVIEGPGDGSAAAQAQQVVEVTIKDYKFVTKQGPLRLGLPTVIKVRNEDAERHDFGSAMFEGLSVKVEKDGVIVIDYNWCIGCRYCMAACPYWARRFNWSQPEVPLEEVNPNQHYLGNRARKKGCVEKCTFCIQRVRNTPGRFTACVEVCPVGARKFGTLLDPESEIRYVIENKRVFILKEDLNTYPKFYYFFAYGK